MSNKGGYRPGAGRPHGSGKYKEITQPIRVPVSLMPQIKVLLDNPSLAKMSDAENKNAIQSVPLYSFRVAAGSPAYADDRIESYLNFNEYFIKNPCTTFCVRAKDNSMIRAGIHDNDILVVDNSIKPTNGKIVIARLNSEIIVNRFKMKKGEIRLIPENPDFSPIKITVKMNFKMLGVVIHVIHAV